MGILSSVLDKLKKTGASSEADVTSKSAVQSMKNWYTDRYEKAVIQRNLMFLTLVVSVCVIGLCAAAIRYIKHSKTIEPFVIEIERKSGIPTVVEPVTAEVYSADDAIKRYFVLQYVKAREEYFPTTFAYNYGTVVKLLSRENVYAEYRAKNKDSNPSSPVNVLGQNGYREFQVRSMVPQTKDTMQVRFYVNTTIGPSKTSMPKFALVQFTFDNLKLNQEERLINPLGFRVILYKVEDEKS